METSLKKYFLDKDNLLRINFGNDNPRNKSGSRNSAKADFLDREFSKSLNPRLVEDWLAKERNLQMRDSSPISLRITPMPESSDQV